ncbi:MAG: hypothetical protein J0I86_18050 [Mesorhizobium sp.]|mgnify:CR=1 FL=1|nr:hypothetical protein [Mesorhizobium sp.]
MSQRKRTYTPQETALAKQLYERAKATGTLKRPRAIAALALSNGVRQVASASTVTFRDYLRDARQQLARRTSS